MSADPDSTASLPPTGKVHEEPPPPEPATEIPNGVPAEFTSDAQPAEVSDPPALAEGALVPPSNGAAADGNGLVAHESGGASVAASFPSFPAPGAPASSFPAPPQTPSAAALPAQAPSGKPPPPKAEPEPEPEHAMTLWEHLDELRSRIIRMILAFIGGGIFSWIYREELLGWLTAPFVKAWPKVGPGAAEQAALHFPSPASLFLAYVRLAMIGGLVFSLPFILYQLWAFIAPGLYSREKKFAAPFVISSCALFALGGWFGWRFAFPVAFQYLLGFADFKGLSGIKIEPTVMISEYIEFVTHMLLAFGFMSELPVLVFFLSIAGLVNHRHLLKFFRYFVVVAFVVAAVITPPDPMSQLMLAVPLIFLYGVSILVAFVFGRKNLKKEEAKPA
jgi:sec-independent protein translocase protein TatC